MSRDLHFYYDIRLEFDAPVTGHAFALRCVPPSFPGQEILDVELSLEPCTSYACQRDGFGNLLQIGRIEAPHDHFRYTVRGNARLAPEKRRPEPVHPIYRYPSAYTRPSGEMLAFLKGLDLEGTPRAQAEAICDGVHRHMTYTPGATGVSTTGAEAFAAGAGVCQDYAHIYLALARQAGLTARYCNGLPEGEGASHAWCEVWLEGCWTGIDPTRNRWTDDSYIRFNVGRDFGDCPMERGVFLGRTGQTQTVFMRVAQNQSAYAPQRRGEADLSAPGGREVFCL